MRQAISLFLSTVITYIFFIINPIHSSIAADHTHIKIGVLGFRSPEKALDKWALTAEYLDSAIPEYTIEIVPMNYPEIEEAVINKKIDFLLTNTGHYVNLEAQYGISRIATLVKSFQEKSIKTFGGVLFTRSDRSDINTLSDLKNKHLLAVGENSLGAFLVAWRELKQVGIDPYSDLSKLEFIGVPQDNIVFKVLAGEADAGTVRTSILENMSAEGQIDMKDIKILGSKTTKDFPFIHSTALYPEWPFARLAHTDDDITQKITVALLTLQPNSPATIAGGYRQWTPPSNYQIVHELFKELRTGPYKDFGAFTLADVIHKHLVVLLLILLTFCILIAFIIKIIHLNYSLKKALSEVKILSGFLPICSSCKKIRDDSGYWSRIETYIRQRSDAEFSHSICPDCSKKLFEEYENDKENPE
jgi:two-component system sensor histidine kinase TtrS